MLKSKTRCTRAEVRLMPIKHRGLNDCRLHIHVAIRDSEHRLLKH